MTTIAEVKRWTRPLLAEHHDLALKPRQLYLRPVHHVFQSVFFAGSSDKTHPKPMANYQLLFAPPSGPRSDAWERELLVGWSTDPGFEDKLARIIRKTFAYPLRPLGSIAGLYAMTGTTSFSWHFKTTRPLSSAPILHATVLAALGRLPEAAATAQAYIDANESQWLSHLAQGQAMQAMPRKSAEASSIIKLANGFLKPMDELRQLVAVASANDRRAVAALLHDWERQGAHRLGLEDDWEPTPFPLEAGL